MILFKHLFKIKMMYELLKSFQRFLSLGSGPLLFFTEYICKIFIFSTLVLGSFDVPSSITSSSGILGAETLPLKPLICCHKYELSLFSAINFERMGEFVLFRQNL